MKAMDHKEANSIIRHKMCEIAGIEFDTVTWDDGSHLKLKYSRAQSQQFIDWMVNELVKNASFRNAVARYPSIVKSKKWALKLAESFEANYGFSVIW